MRVEKGGGRAKVKSEQRKFIGIGGLEKIALSRSILSQPSHSIGFLLLQILPFNSFSIEICCFFREGSEIEAGRGIG
jgi:hypothetical protein